MRCPGPQYFPWHELQDAGGQADIPGEEEGDISSIAWQEAFPASTRMQEGTWTPGALQNLSASLSLCVTDKHTGSQPHIWMRKSPYHLKSNSSIPKSLLSSLSQWLNYLWQQPEQMQLLLKTPLNPSFVPLPQSSPEYFTMTFSPPGATQVTNAISPQHSHSQPEWAQMMRISSSWGTCALKRPWSASTSSAHLREDNHPGRPEQHVQETGLTKPGHHSFRFDKTCADITQNSSCRYSVEAAECEERF